MEAVMRVKKSLRTPIRKLTTCVSGMKERKLCAKPRSRKSRGMGGRGGCNKMQLRTAHHHRDVSFVRSYQADLEKERRQREEMNARKNAQRAAMRDHFRRKYQLTENLEDTYHLRSVGGKVSLPRELSKIIHPETKNKDEGFNLLSAFQGLSIGSALLTGRKHSTTSTPTPVRGDSCKVM